MITIRGVELKTKVSEMTLKEYENFLTTYNNTELHRLEKFISLLIVCGMKDDKILSEVTTSEVKLFIEELNKDSEELVNIVPTKNIELNGRNYIAVKGDEFELSFKDISEIEKIIKTKNKWLLPAMAVVFKDEELTHVEHYTQAHLKYKETLLANVTASMFVPYILWIQKEFLTNLATESDVQEIDEIMTIIDEATK